MAPMKRVFVSYSSHDREVAQRVCRSLEKEGIPCWIAPRDIAPGANWGGSIAEAIDDAAAMVLVFSRNADNSDQIKKELVLAGDARKVVIPARVEDLLPINPSFRYELSSRQWIDLFDDWEAGISRIAERVRQIQPAPAAVEASARVSAPPAPPAATLTATPVPAPAGRGGARYRTGLYAGAVVAAVALAVGGYLVVANRTAPVTSASTPAATSTPAPAPAPVKEAAKQSPSGSSACGRAVGTGIFNKWTELGGQQGVLGCAISDEAEATRSPLGTTGRYALFDKGVIVWHRDGPQSGAAYEIHGCNGRIYQSMGGTGSWLGFPVGDERDVPGGRQSDFQGGYIFYDAQTRHCEAHRAPAAADAGPEAKAFAEAQRVCVDTPDNEKTAEAIVASCTAALKTGLGTANDKAMAHAHRGSAENARNLLDAAMEDADRAIELDPKYAYGYWVRAHVYRKQRQFEQAIADFEQYMRLVPNSVRAFYWRGNSYLDLGDAQRAVRDYDEASRLDPKYWPAWQNRCLAYNKLGRYDEALAQCSEAIRLNPPWWGSYQTRGETYTALGKPDLASQDFEEAKKRKSPPPAPPPVQAAAAPQPARVFYNGNIGGVANGGRPPQFTLNVRTRITYVMTYHWNDAKGHRPGTIALVSAGGVTYGPWRASGQPGQGGVPDAYWIAHPNVVLPAGVYQVVDSDPASWAQNRESLGLGMTEIKGVPE